MINVDTHNVYVASTASARRTWRFNKPLRNQAPIFRPEVEFASTGHRIVRTGRVPGQSEAISKSAQRGYSRVGMLIAYQSDIARSALTSGHQLSPAAPSARGVRFAKRAYYSQHVPVGYLPYRVVSP
ncbi:hypothetical protein B0H16DRAFT_1452381 [Mycena metata]|uniref:Uncharacterized protein n=1 Tax=Mycena metata TaxID=1033252 RepID=A0AAD7NQB3_9AGAR|nr:hypothetical protein B0H16DRAFT_1452381 [Mycena metata]